MIEEPAPLRIVRDLRRPRPEQVAALSEMPTGFVLDAMKGQGAMSADISPLPGLPQRACGPALVAGNQPGDILGTLAAIHHAQAGDVIVAQAHGHRGCAAGGDRVMGMLKNRGAAGFVTDGVLRDMDGIEAVGLPCWCTGLTPNSPVTRGPATLGLPIDIGGLRVAQGDVVVADRDGVVIVPFERLGEVIAAVAQVAKAESALDAEVAAGRDGAAAISRMLESGDGVEWL